MKNSKLQVLFGYSMKLFCDGLECMVQSFNGFELRGSLPFGKELTVFLKLSNNIDILFVEIMCPTRNDLEIIKEIMKISPLVKIFLISNRPQGKISTELIDAGISAYLLKSCNKQDLLSALEKIIDNKNYYCTEITKAILLANNHSNNTQQINLSEREEEVLGLLINCNTNKQIAENLSLSENTIKTHRRNIHAKFGVNNLIGMVRYACRANLISHGTDDYCKYCPKLP